MNIFRLISSNIRKRKGASVTFFVMVIISSLMLSISLSLLIGGANFFEKKVNELNAPHYSTYIMKDSYKDELDSFTQNYEGVTDISKIDLLFAVGTWKIGSNEQESSIFIYNQDEYNEKSFYKPPLINSLEVQPDNMIILPLSFKSYGANSGDKIKIYTSGIDYEFTIYAFVEDAIFGASTAGASIAYISNELYDSFSQDSNYINFTSLMVRFKNIEMHRLFKADFRKFANLEGNEEFYISFDAAEANAMLFIGIVSMVLIVFSMIILVIAFIVVFFSISNSISEDISTIGALKSMGYKNKILKFSRLIEFVLIAAMGSIIGTLISLLTFGFLGNIIASTSGLLWLNDANIIPIILTIIIICALTAVITYLSVIKYKKITPINALRQGDSNHSFKKNTIPLEKYNLPINFHLGIKRFFNVIKNNIILCFIVSLLVFISVLVNCLSYNLNNDRTAMIQMVGLEMSDIYVQVNPGSDINEINKSIESDDQVKFTILYGTTDCSINGFDTYVETVNNYSLLTINTVIEGRSPSLYNEINLGATVSKIIGKGINDTVTVDIDGIKLSYIVVGITQSIGNAAENCSITSGAMINQNPEFMMSTIYVYLNDSINTKMYIDSLASTYGNKILMANPDEQMDTILSSMGDPFMAVSVIMIIVTIIVIAFVLFLIISVIIRKQKKEFGIMKAIGFKNRQLILQTIISFLPSLMLGTVIGITLGFTFTNQLLSVFFKTAGLLKAYFIIPVFSTIVISFGILAASILMSYVISLRLKKISPQKLITE